MEHLHWVRGILSLLLLALLLGHADGVFAARPANDLFQDAEAVPARRTTEKTIVDVDLATDTQGDPQFRCKRDRELPWGFHGIWYKITPATPVRVTISTAGTTVRNRFGVTDTLLGVYTGIHGSLIERACNDDADFDAGDLTSRLVIDRLDPGITYYVFVAQAEALNVFPQGQLHVTFAFAPEHDVFERARTIEMGPDGYSDTVEDADTATVSPNDPWQSCAWGGWSPGQYNLWYRFTAPPHDGFLRIDATNSLGRFEDNVVSVLRGSPGQFTTVACSDHGTGTEPGALLWAPVEAGVTYTVYVSAADGLPELERTGTLVLQAAFSRPDPRVGIYYTGPEIRVSEAGETKSYGVYLWSRPSDEVTVTITPDDQLRTDKTSLVFTQENWNDIQEVVVSAVDDDVDDNGLMGWISHSVSSRDPAYNNLPVDDLSAFIVDDDVAGVRLDRDAISVRRGGDPARYAISLSSQPVSAVDITFDAPAGIALVPDTVHFAPTQWREPQTIEVRASDDAVDGVVAHMLDTRDPIYQAVVAPSLAVEVLAADQQDNPDLAVEIRDDTDVVMPGALHDYVVTVSALGGTDVAGARFTSELPTQLRDVGWTCAPAAGCPATAGTGNPDLLLDLAAGQPLTLIISGTVADDAIGSMIQRVAIVPPSPQTDPAPGNNQATDTNRVDSFGGGGFADGFESLVEGIMGVKVRPDWHGNSVRLDQTMLSTLADASAGVPVSTLDWRRADATLIAVHVLSSQGRRRVRLATRDAEGNWRRSEWIPLAEHDYEVRVDPPDGVPGVVQLVPRGNGKSAELNYGPLPADR